MIKRLLATLEISRPHNMVAAAGCVYAGYYVSGGRGFATVMWPAVCTALVAGLGNLVNDVFDSEIDRINKPRRPIPSGRLARGYVAWLYGVGTAILTAFMIAVLPLSIFALMVVWEFLLFVYASKAKRVAVLGNVLIAGVCASAFIVGTMVTGAHEAALFAVAFAFVFVMGRELVKGAEDVEGDRIAGAKTLAVRFGAERTARWGAMLVLLCVVAAPAPGILRYYGGEYRVLMQVVAVPGMLAAAYIILRFPSKAMFNRASWILKLEMLVGIFVMGLGRL